MIGGFLGWVLVDVLEDKILGLVNIVSDAIDGVGLFEEVLGDSRHIMGLSLYNVAFVGVQEIRGVGVGRVGAIGVALEELVEQIR